MSEKKILLRIKVYFLYNISIIISQKQIQLISLILELIRIFKLIILNYLKTNLGN